MAELSPEGIAAVMKLHGHSLKEGENPFAHHILKGILGQGLVRHNSETEYIAGRSAPFSVFIFLRQVVLEKYEQQLDNQHLYQIMGVFDFLDHMVDKDGMNLPAEQVFRFLYQELGMSKT